MRWLVAVLLLTMAMPVHAQAQATGVPDLLQDARGDVTLTLADGTKVPDGDTRAHLDLLALSATEAVDSFTFTLRVAALAAEQRPITGDASYYIRMAHEDAEYQVQIQRRGPLGGGPAIYTGSIEEGHKDHFGRVLEATPVIVNTGADELTVAVPRDRLLDLRGAAPFPGRSLAVHVVTASFPIFGNSEETLRVRDAMPDDGRPAALPVLLGDIQTGDAVLAAPDPTRVSNGEATTHAFSVLARNLGANEALFTLSVEGLPSGWQVTVPVPLLRIPAGGEANGTVLVTTPFAHEHGLYRSFKAVLTKEGDAGSRGTATLGVRYTEVPQPAGHHDTLYLHGRGASAGPLGSQATINTLQDDPNDDGMPITGSASCSDGPDLRRHFWLATLDPPLRMGLDFDLARTGTFEATVHAARPMLGARLSGHLVHEEFGVLATIAESGPQDLQRDATMPVSLEVTPAPEADLVPYLKDKNIFLALTLVSGPGQVPPGFCPDVLSPSILPGAALRLPLLEYHDPLPIPAASLLEADGAVRRTVAPGSVVQFPIHVQATSGGAVALDLFGVNSDWARLVGETRPHLDRGQSAQFAVEVTIPSGASASDRVDLVVQAVPAAGSEASFLRLVVEVDPAAAVVHEALGDGGGRASPGTGLVGALAVLVSAVAGSIRRRRH